MKLILSHADKQLDALVVDDLNVDVLAGTPFRIANDIAARPAKCRMCIQDSEVIHYKHRSAQALLPMLCDMRSVTLFAHHRLQLFFGLGIT